MLDLLGRFYGNMSDPGGHLHSFHVTLQRRSGVRRIWRRQIEFFMDEGTPFDPFPLDHAFPLFEWGLNWCIAMRAHQFLMLHSAVVERAGHALLLPALPGSGKSTLCAALALRGWRLLADEFGLVDIESQEIVPLPRPVPLKNQSIEVIRSFSSQAVLGPVFPNTRKGDVAHLVPPGESLRLQARSARARWIVFPSFRRGSGLELTPLARSAAFVRLAQNAFNYGYLRGRGFDALTRLVNRCDAYSLRFGSLDDAIAVLADLQGE